MSWYFCTSHHEVSLQGILLENPRLVRNVDRTENKEGKVIDCLEAMMEVTGKDHQESINFAIMKLGSHKMFLGYIGSTHTILQLIASVTIFSISNTSSPTPSLFPSSILTNTHTHSQVISHSHTRHITHHTHSHHGPHHHDIIYDSHSLSMTSSKIQTQPTSNSVINRDLISNHPLSLIKILIRSNPH
jgi:hypothetical protein